MKNTIGYISYALKKVKNWQLLIFDFLDRHHVWRSLDRTPDISSHFMKKKAFSLLFFFFHYLKRRKFSGHLKRRNVFYLFKHGSTWLNSAQLCSTWLNVAQCGWTRLDLARLSSIWLDSAWLDSAYFLLFFPI